MKTAVIAGRPLMKCSESIIFLILKLQGTGFPLLNRMNKLIYTICGFMFATVFSASAAKPTSQNLTPPKQHSTTHTVAATRAASEAEEMNLASVSRTNPFEIVPAAGMELLSEPGFQSEESAALTADMLGFAKRFMGIRYRHGGRSPKTGFDCSGFTSYIYSNFGYSLSPSSAVQYTQGRKVKRDEVQPGDLLFFTGRASRSGRVGHVGIAVSADPASGEITFIHAARSGIRIDKVSAAYYAKRYLGARRVLPS